MLSISPCACWPFLELLSQRPASSRTHARTRAAPAHSQRRSSDPAPSPGACFFLPSHIFRRCWGHSRSSCFILRPLTSPRGLRGFSGFCQVDPPERLSSLSLSDAPCSSCLTGCVSSTPSSPPHRPCSLGAPPLDGLIHSLA